jgi:hypothetical protein
MIKIIGAGKTREFAQILLACAYPGQAVAKDINSNKLEFLSFTRPNAGLIGRPIARWRSLACWKTRSASRKSRMIISAEAIIAKFYWALSQDWRGRRMHVHPIRCSTRATRPVGMANKR